MPVKSQLSIPIPHIDLPSFLLDNIPDPTFSCDDPKFIRPFIFSAEHPEAINLSLVQFKHWVKCFAAGLQGAGLQAGDHLMLVSPNYIYAMIVCLGTIAAGGVVCISQPDFSVCEYVGQFRQDEPKFLLVCDDELLMSKVLTAWQTVDGDRNRVWVFDQFLSAKGRQLKHSKHNDSEEIRNFWTELLDVKRGPAFRWKRFSIEQECRTPCQIIYTSGTTGIRKCALISHQNLVAALVGTSYRIQTDAVKAAQSKPPKKPLNGTRRMLHTISIARGFGTSLPLALTKARQHRNVEVYFMSRTSCDMDPYLNCLEKLKINEAFCAPFTMIQMFANGKIKYGNKYNFSYLSSITVTGGPSSQSALNGARDFLVGNGASEDLRIERAFGVTEAASIVSHWHMADPPDRTEGYQGRLEPNFEAKVMVYENEEEDGVREVEPYQPGEIWVRSPSCVQCYYRNPEASREQFTDDGWYKTGDIGFFRDDKLYLLDRKKVEALEARE
jgi:4-coumarate--CoA ligase